MDRKMQRELKGVVSALRTHAAKSTQLADSISRLLQDPIVSSGLVETTDSETIVVLMQNAREELPDWSKSLMTRLANMLSNIDINTVDELRKRIQEHGQPDLNRSAAPYWWKCTYNVGRKQIELLIAIVDHFAI